ncbi:hypothetical protein PACTADRAFT_639 [Pachysolen tannophilus NRRL Y-2460]|uniref:Uncharacterized protein n=1 Tax=Pachysolen tannophilus NRRL Y-2460 TaxID=669874 RepID=A0A1E4U2C9_PACTA|nr:hypothetical protein PACTADRAFT_639 [Pachysolen tannophilus NRRL Y-2460]
MHLQSNSDEAPTSPQQGPLISGFLLFTSGITSILGYLSQYDSALTGTYGDKTLNFLHFLVIRIYIVASRPFKGIRTFYYSDACIYPIKLWSSLQVILPRLAISFLAYFFSFIIFLPSQIAVSFIFGGPFGFCFAIISCIQHGHYYSTFISENVLLYEPRDLIFDNTMIISGNNEIVLNGRLRRIIKVPFITRLRRFIWGIPSNLVFMPVEKSKLIIPTIYNSVPILGPIILKLNNASAKGMSYQKRYFNLKNLKKSQIGLLGKKKTGNYASFAFTAAILESIPILGFLFELTNSDWLPS